MENVVKTGTSQGGEAKAEAKTGVVREQSKKVVTPDPKTQAFDLAKTIKAVEELHRLIKHRDLFENYRDQLGEFEFTHKDAAFEEKNTFVNCTLKITDDKNRTFEIKSPSVIKATVEYLATRFEVMLKETEGKIKLPIGNVA